MNETKARRLALTAVLTALCCAATAFIKLPLPVVGYIHVGDSIVYLSAFLLGPTYGAFAAGIGSALADILSGYVIYAPATLIIKALTACLCGRLCSSLNVKGDSHLRLGFGLLSGIIVVIGYFLYEVTALGLGNAAFAGIPFNVVQTVFGVVSGSILFINLKKLGVFPEK